MNEKTGCITINCGCCGNGSNEENGETSSNLNLLFDGEADTVNSNYQLLGNVTDYKIIIVEIGDLYNINMVTWTKRYECIVLPEVSLEKEKYIGTVTVNSILVNSMVRRGLIYWHFPEKDVLCVDFIALATDSTKMAILKIYGIK